MTKSIHVSETTWSPTRPRRGFTLIEVIAALVIFSAGVLMVIQVSGALGRQMTYSSARSRIVVLANEQLDSVEAVPFDSIVVGTVVTNMQFEGWSYQRSVVITQVTPVLYQVVATLTPLAGPNAGPSFSATSYTSAIW